MCDTWLAAHRCLGCRRGGHGWGAAGLCAGTSPARAHRGNGSDLLWESWGLMGCALFGELHSGEGLGEHAEDARITQSPSIPLAWPGLLGRAGQEGDRAGVWCRGSQGTKWRSSNSHQYYPSFYLCVWRGGLCLGVALYSFPMLESWLLFAPGPIWHPQNFNSHLVLEK